MCMYAQRTLEVFFVEMSIKMIHVDLPSRQRGDNLKRLLKRDTINCFDFIKLFTWSFLCRTPFMRHS